MHIVIEGYDGCGKTTLVGNLQKALERETGRPVVVSREPSGRIREVVLSAEEQYSDLTRLLLFMADRAHNVEKLIRPCLQSRIPVVCDRGTLSTFAYQRHGAGLDFETVDRLTKLATQGVEPDLILFLLLPLEDCLKRTEGVDAFETRDREFQQRVYSGYLMESCMMSNLRTLRITAEDTPEDVLRLAMQTIRDKGLI